MSDKSRNGEDIASLFAAFGGDVGRYQEFDNGAASEQSPSWTLLQQLGADPQEAAAHVPPPAHPPVTATANVITPPPAPATLPPAARAFPTAAGPAAPDLAQAFSPDPGFQAKPVFSSALSQVPPAAVRPAPPPASQALFAAAPSAAPVIPSNPPATPAFAAAGPAPVPTGTPLAALFERLASAPAPDAPARHSLMAHWRQSG